MGCCKGPRRKFLTKVDQAKKQIKPLTDVPDNQLTSKQLRVKNRMIRVKNRTERIERRNKRAVRIKAHNERKALNS